MISYKLMVSYYLRDPVGLYFMHLYVNTARNLMRRCKRKKDRLYIMVLIEKIY